MNYEPTRVTVDGKEYDFHRIGVRPLNRLLIKALKLVGEPLASSIDSDVAELAKEDKEKAKEAIDVKAIVKALSASLDETVVDEIIDGLLQQTSRVGIGPVKTKFDEIFEDDIAHMWAVVFAAANHYYASFLAGGLGFLKI